MSSFYSNGMAGKPKFGIQQKEPNSDLGVVQTNHPSRSRIIKPHLELPQIKVLALR